MTVPVQDTFTASTANGVTTVFPYGFKIAAAEDLVVTIDDVIQTTGYTVSGVGSPSGGNVTFDTAPANGAEVIRYLDPILKRDTDYQQFGDWRAQNVNLDFDRIWLALRSMKQLATRAIKMRVNTTDDQVITEAPADRALKVIGFDALGKLKLYVAQAGTSLIDLAASTGSSLVGFIQAGAGSVLRTVRDKMRESSSIEDFGASPTASAATNTAAIHAAIAAAHAAGGGIVRIPAKTYAISEVTFGAVSNVILQGESNGYDYGNGKSASAFSVLSGVFGVRFSEDCAYCGLVDIGLSSNGLLSGTAPHTITTAGVEYGVVIETGFTIMRRVSVYGFQYGCVLANAGNSNVFDECGFVWNTKVGFACTSGSANAYAAYHPNLSAPASPLNTTVFTMSNCNIRRNGWGMILRDGSGTFNNLVVESNHFGGLLEYVGTLDSGVSGTWNQCYFEANWIAYDTSVSFTAAAVTSNNLLQETLGVWIPFTTGTGDTTTDDAGYQITMMSKNAGVNAGPGYQYFRNTSIVMTSPTTATKALWIKSATHTTFIGGSATAGDQTNAVRLSAGVSNGAGDFWYANQTVFWDSLNWPTAVGGTYGNRGARVGYARSGEAGFVAEAGYFQGLAGNVKFPSTQSASSDVNTLDDYEEANYNPTVTSQAGTLSTVSATGSYTKVGRLCHFSFDITITTNGTGASALSMTLPFASTSDSCGIGRERTVSGFSVTAQVLVGQSSATLVKTANDLYPGGDGYRILGSLTFMTAT